MRNLIALCAGPIVAAALLATTATASADELVTFDSARYLVGSLQQKLARERGEPLIRTPTETIQGFLSKPDGAGPFPAVVHLHGCGGLAEQRRVSAAKQFTDWGYVTLIVDGFTTRGIKEACDWAQIPSRQADATGALIYLSKLPFVDPMRVAVVGYSQGGMAALGIASGQPAELFDIPDGMKFKAAVAYYPICSAAANKLEIPTLILIGELDDWSRAVECRWLTKRLDRNSAPLTLTIFPEAHHSFDSPSASAGMRHLGHLLRYNAAVTERAAAQTREFLVKELPK